MKKIIRLTESDLTRIVKTIISETKFPYVKKYIAVITGPEEYLPGGKLIEEFTISEEDIEDYLSEDDGTVEEAIEYFMDEYSAEWEQRWCNVQFYTMEEFEKISNYKPSLGFRRR